MRKLILILALAVPLFSGADELLMARVTRPFPETMTALQDAIRARGYVISRVQRVDVGLSSSGFQTAEYRIVFFGKPDEIRFLTRDHVELIAYLPLNIVVFAEGDDSILLSSNPLQLEVFLGKPALHETVVRWQHDVTSVFDEMSQGP